MIHCILEYHIGGEYMSKTVESTIKVKAIFNEAMTHRYAFTKTWDSTKKKALVIMKNPASNGLVETDVTTMLVLNNLSQLDYGSVTICNIYSSINTSLQSMNSADDCKENFSEIAKQAKVADTIIIAWGSFGEGNQSVKTKQGELMDILKAYKDKLMYISNPKEIEKGVHPLCPSVRSRWNLKQYVIEDKKILDEKTKAIN